MIKKLLFINFFFIGMINYGQSMVQSINTGSIIGTQAIVTVGEIIVTPENNQQSHSGILGILAQTGQLSTTPFNIHEDLTVYPNPTVSTLHFSTSKDLSNEKLSVFDVNGKLVLKTIIQNNSIDLQTLELGLYIIQFENKQYPTFKIIKK